MIKTIGLIGSGHMGHTIALAALAVGMQVRMVSRDPERAGGDFPPDEEGLVIGGYDVLSDAELVIEAVPESRIIKREALQSAAAVMPAGAILATCTSSLTIAELSRYIPQRPLAALHFFFPANRVHLVEAHLDGLNEDDKASVRQCLLELGATVVDVADQAGFVVNRLLSAMLCEAHRLVIEGVATQADIDAAIRNGLRWRQGPFEIERMVGPGTIEAIRRNLEVAHGPRFALHRPTTSVGLLGC